MWLMTRAPGLGHHEKTADTPVWWCTECEASLPPEGTASVVDEDTTTIDDLPPEERAELMAVLDAGIADMRAGRVVKGDEIVRRLLARS